MKDLFASSLFFGFVLSLGAYEVGLLLKRKFKFALFNPLLISVVLVILFLTLFDIDYEVYNEGANVLTWLLTPATVALAVPLYEELRVLKDHPVAIILGILSGVVTSLGGIYLLSLLFGLSHTEYVTLLPKSVTTAIGMPLSSEYGGYPSITVAAIIITGIFGNITAEAVLKLFHVKASIAKGVAIGTASHAIGTTKANQMGSVEGAVSSLALVVSGLVTIVLFGFFCA